MQAVPLANKQDILFVALSPLKLCFIVTLTVWTSPVLLFKMISWKLVATRIMHSFDKPFIELWISVVRITANFFRLNLCSELSVTLEQLLSWQKTSCFTNQTGIFRRVVEKKWCRDNTLARVSTSSFPGSYRQTNERREYRPNKIVRNNFNAKTSSFVWSVDWL